MQANCTLSRVTNGTVRLRHSSSTLGDVEVTGASREEAAARMQRELQYRYELCPCSGTSMGTVKLSLREDGAS